jgi:hypothetical protein
MFLLAARSPLHDRGNFLFRDNFSALCDKKLPKSLAANDGIRQIGQIKSPPSVAAVYC